jgi:hypothetical protein
MGTACWHTSWAWWSPYLVRHPPLGLLPSCRCSRVSQHNAITEHGQADNTWEPRMQVEHSMPKTSYATRMYTQSELCSSLCPTACSAQHKHMSTPAALRHLMSQQLLNCNGGYRTHAQSGPAPCHAARNSPHVQTKYSPLSSRHHTQAPFQCKPPANYCCCIVARLVAPAPAALLALCSSRCLASSSKSSCSHCACLLLS